MSKVSCSNLIAHLSKKEQNALLSDMNYLNMSEIKSFCKKHKIPIAIMIETDEGLVRSKDHDRKAIILDRMRHYLLTGVVKKPTVFPKRVVSSKKEADFAPSDKVLYSGYQNRNRRILKMMKSLTNGKFKFGAMSQETLRECWAQGKAPTYAQFAELWQQAVDDPRPHPEAAFLTDLERGTADKDWKKLRNEKAKAVLGILNSILISV
jgi:hypothetical protein